MKNILIFFVICCLQLNAQEYGSEEKKIILEKGAGCAPPTTSTYMEINNVRALMHTAGNLWQIPGQNNSQYEVPKNSGIMALFTAALWLGGTDVNEQLKLAALRYRNGQDYWTGPLSEVFAETDYETCDAYDQHFITTQDMIREFTSWYSAGIADQQNGTNTQSTLFPNYEVPDIIKNWPAHGDLSAGQDYYLAPFYDYNEDGHYNWQDGDYPWHDINRTKECTIDRTVSLYGDLNFWWVMNDKGNIHTETGADPIGMEIRSQAFSFASNDEVNNMTFYNYELINRGTQTLYDTYFGFFTDGALGDPYDDYVGCDVNRGLAYYYNGDNLDLDNAGYKGYGSSPPAVGVDFFEGPYQDNDGIDNAFGINENEALNGIGFGDGIPDNERFGMRRFLYYSNTTNGANPNQTDPTNASDYYNYLKGFWKDGTKFVYGGSGHISDAEADPNTPCDFMFPGDTDPLGWGTDGNPQAPWTEQSSNNTPNDRRFVQSAGPFVLKPGSVNNITVGVVWARATSGDPFASVEVLKKADDKAQALFENCFKILEGPHSPDLFIQELENELILTIDNSSSSNNYKEAYEEFDPFIVADDPSADRYFRFQGYQIFQLVDDEVSLSELDDPAKARLVAQCDKKDGVGRLVNFEFDEALSASMPIEMVDGSDQGIRHSFKITEDRFAQGSPTLVNHKTYFFMAISYAYNNYKQYDPEDATLLDGQKKPYLPCRKAAVGAVKVVSAIPHSPAPEAGGTLQMIGYGSSPQITRLDGHGNGDRDLELTQESIDEILDQGSMLSPTYDYGKGPINVKVVDPLNLASGYFECKFRDYTVQSSGNAADTASWVIYRYASEDDIVPLDSVTSQRTIAFDNEQIVPEWGISVQIKQQKYFVPPNGNSGGPDTKTTTMISSSINFADSSKQWLTGVNDNDAYFPTNWIICGEYDPDEDTDCLPNGPSYLNPCNYQDEITKDQSPVWEGLLEGIIAPHQLVGYQADYSSMAYIGNVASNVRKNAAISFAPSVDIVFTSNQDLWTRCPVFETGRDAGLNIGGVSAGSLRASNSVGKDGMEDGSGTGMGWFPGYAIDLETGARLYMAFGENSFLGGENGADMIWNPTSNLVSNVGTPLMGGVHPIYVYSKDIKTVNGYLQSYDLPAYNPAQAESPGGHQLRTLIDNAQSSPTSSNCRPIYATLSWVCYPMLAEGQELLSTDVTIKLRINKEYKNYVATGQNDGKPMYSWSMDDIATVTASKDQLKEALDMINIVPNPYYAFSEYERSRLDTRIKFTNLPEICTIRIYTINGKLVRTFMKDSPITSLDWNLTNQVNIPVASGIYLVHVTVPGIGERILKAFISMRTPDLHGI